MKSTPVRIGMLSMVLLGLAVWTSAASGAPPKTMGGGPESGPLADALRVDLNTADSSSLAKIPVIGTEFAGAIIANRPYRTLDDLMRVPGFGITRVSRLRGMVTISQVPVASRTNSSRVGEPQAPGRDNDAKAFGREHVLEKADSSASPNPRAETPANTAPEKSSGNAHGSAVREGDAKSPSTK